jgi:hypothetical protein
MDMKATFSTHGGDKKINMDFQLQKTSKEVTSWEMCAQRL